MSGRPFPLDHASRAEVRAANRARLVARAETAAAVEGMSLGCADATLFGNHPTGEPGCRNVGDGCLCPCHDTSEDPDRG